MGIVTVEVFQRVRLAVPRWVGAGESFTVTRADRPVIELRHVPAYTVPIHLPT